MVIMKRFKLTKEEQEIEDYIDKGEYKSLLTPELKKYYQEVARYSIKMRKLEQAKLKKKETSSRVLIP
jgi:hypothetical protein